MKKLLLLLLFIPLVFSCSSGSEEPPPPPIKYTLTTAANPTAGGTVTPASGQHNEDATVSITATPAGEYLFSSWSGATGTTATTSVVMNSNKTVTANFIKKKYALTTTVEGEGTVTEKVIKAGAATDYNSGTIVELTATPSDEWEFKEWTGDVTGAENPTQITIDKAKTVKAVFESIPPFYLDENGVTIKAKDWVTVGTSGELNGITYTAVDNSKLKSMIGKKEDVTKIVTTLVSDMSWLINNSANTFTVFNQDISSWDVSNVTSMESMFYRATRFNQPIGDWDVGNVTNMKSMFHAASKFNQPIGDWDVSNVTNMQQMFVDASKFNQPIGSWNLSKVTNISFMFQGASAFDQPIGDWDVSNVTNMQAVFWGLNGIGEYKFNQPIGDWDVSNVTHMMQMFYGAEKFNQDLSKWNVSAVTDMYNMFFFAKAFNQPIGDWDVSNVTDMYGMFSDATTFNQDLSKWCVANLLNTLSDVQFMGGSALTYFNTPTWGACPNSYTISVTANSNTDYTLNGKDRNGEVSGNDPSLTFKVGDQITFSVNADNHPFYLKIKSGTGSSDKISEERAKNNGTTNGSIVWKQRTVNVENASNGTYYYQCSTHEEMVGKITIENN